MNGKASNKGPPGVVLKKPIQLTNNRRGGVTQLTTRGVGGRKQKNKKDSLPSKEEKVGNGVLDEKR